MSVWTRNVLITTGAVVAAFWGSYVILKLRHG